MTALAGPPGWPTDRLAPHPHLPEPGWLPAPFSTLLHVVSPGSPVHGDGPDAIAGTVCGRAASVSQVARRTTDVGTLAALPGMC